MDDSELSARARSLAAVIEPFAAQVYFSPECHAEYVSLGFGPSPGDRNGVAQPDGPAYFCSRGSLLGQVPGELVASAFAVFNPSVVAPAVTVGWSITDAKTRRGLAVRRPASGIPGRRAHGFLDFGGLRRHRDRSADRALLGSATEELRPVAGLVGD
jgi:hypothetical protein